MQSSVKQIQGRSVLLEQTLIILLLISIGLLSVYMVYKYQTRTPAITPQQLKMKTLTEQVKASPNNIEYRLALAYAYQQAKDYKTAKQEYQTVLSKKPDELAALYNLGLIAKEEHKSNSAIEYFQQVLGLKQNHLLASLGLAQVYLAEDRNEEAIKILDNILNSQGYLAEPRLLKARALEQLGDKGKALAEYNQVLKFVPEHKEAQAGKKRLES